MPSRAHPSRARTATATRGRQRRHRRHRHHRRHRRRHRRRRRRRRRRTDAQCRARGAHPLDDVASKARGASRSIDIHARWNSNSIDIAHRSIDARRRDRDRELDAWILVGPSCRFRDRAIDRCAISMEFATRSTSRIDRSIVPHRAIGAVVRARVPRSRHSLASSSSSDGVGGVDDVVDGVGIGVGRRWWRVRAPRCAARGRARGIRVDVKVDVKVKVDVDVFWVDAA